MNTQWTQLKKAYAAISNNKIQIYNTSSTATTSAWINTSPSVTGNTWTCAGTAVGQAQAFLTNAISTGSIYVPSGPVKLRPGQELTIELPDGAILELDASGNYKIVDDNAKVTYKANRVREFNKYLNASDMLEEFIDYVADIGGISKREFMELPLELFIKWLVIRAAEADGEEDVQVKQELTQELKQQMLLPSPRIYPRCKCCGRFIRKANLAASLPFCTEQHMLNYAKRSQIF